MPARRCRSRARRADGSLCRRRVDRPSAGGSPRLSRLRRGHRAGPALAQERQPGIPLCRMRCRRRDGAELRSGGLLHCRIFLEPDEGGLSGLPRQRAGIARRIPPRGRMRAADRPVRPAARNRRRLWLLSDRGGGPLRGARHRDRRGRGGVCAAARPRCPHRRTDAAVAGSDRNGRRHRHARRDRASRRSGRRIEPVQPIFAAGRRDHYDDPGFRFAAGAAFRPALAQHQTRPTICGISLRTASPGSGPPPGSRLPRSPIRGNGSRRHWCCSCWVRASASPGLHRCSRRRAASGSRSICSMRCASSCASRRCDMARIAETEKKPGYGTGPADACCCCRPTGPRSARPEDKLSEAISMPQTSRQRDCRGAARPGEGRGRLAMTAGGMRGFIHGAGRQNSTWE